MAAKREEAQQRRSDARKRRRGTVEDQAEPNPPDANAGEQDHADEPLEAIKHAAKVAAAAAAVGAAVGAARAITTKDEDVDDSTAEEREEPQPDEPERRADDEPAAATEHDGTTDDEPESFAAEADDEQAPEEREPEPAAAPSTDRAPQRPTSAGDAQRAVQQAREHLKTLAGHEAESVSSFEPTADGCWTIGLEVLEVARIPESTDVLATYEVTVDDDGNLVSYGRTRRYYRSQAASEEDF